MNQFAGWILSIFNLNAVLLRDSAEFIAFTVRGSTGYYNASECLTTLAYYLSNVTCCFHK